jgi:SAM-dependent methyltransferase
MARLERWCARTLLYRAPRERERCPACDSPRLVTFDMIKLPKAVDGRRAGLLSGCESCGLVFVNPPPSQAALAEMYGPGGEWASYRAEEIPTRDPSSGPAGAGSWTTIFDPIRHELDVTRPPAGARAFDFGCGRGKFLDVLHRCGWETFGLEPAMNTAFARHRRLTAVPGDGSFDLVIAHHVFEHIAEPLALLRQLAAATKLGGHLLVATPRLDTLATHRDFGYLISRVHISAYTSACMETLLARSGWQLVTSPDEEVVIAGGRRTTARLRMLARRVGERVTPPQSPLKAAQAAFRDYYRISDSRPVLRRMGAARLHARLFESRRRIRRWAGLPRAVASRLRQRP